MRQRNFRYVADLFKKSRLEAGLSQEYVAEKLGYSSKGQVISNIENGRCNLPKDKIVKACKILGVDVEAMVGAVAADYVMTLRKYCKLKV